MFLFEAFQFIIGEKYIIQKNCLLVYSLLLWPIVLQANSSPRQVVYPPPSKATSKTPMQIDNSFSVYLFLDSGP